MKPRLLVFVIFLSLVASGRAESESLPDRTLRQLVERQKELLADAAKNHANFDQDNFKLQLQQVSQGYEGLLRDNPDYAPGYAAYGYLLGKVGMRKESIAMLLKANQLDPDQALVKNQIGNFLAEEGKPLEALPYFLAAIKLEPKEPLYHYQLGMLLHEARDDFIRSGEWTADAVDHASHEAFGHAAELAPNRLEFTYRQAESFYDLPVPDWDAALKAWGALEEKAATDVERQTMRLHAANILIKQGKLEHAKLLLATVVEPSLAPQKQKLVAQLAAKPEKQAALPP
ncbi:MAG: Tetratricopeptide 2 repeat protein [Verrucomicrobia bacterium]|nr:Tetratricopeptide 2 repeat protein [Verrucomicrobiota bacterium]